MIPLKFLASCKILFILKMFFYTVASVEVGVVPQGFSAEIQTHSYTAGFYPSPAAR
jgi:hypothetical protein